MSISKEGKLISQSFAELKKFGFLIYNFNTYRAMQRSMSKLCDHIVAGETGLHFVEVKLTSTGDKMSDGQRLFKKVIWAIVARTPWVNYWSVHNLDEAHYVFEQILNGTEFQKGDKLREV